MVPCCQQHTCQPPTLTVKAFHALASSYLYRPTFFHSCTSGSTHIVLVFSYLCAFTLSSAPQYLSNFSVLQNHLENLLKFRSLEHNCRDCFGGLGKGSWDVHLNRAHCPFWCRWSIDFHFEKPFLRPHRWLGVAWNDGFTSEFSTLKLSLLKIGNLSKPIEE